MDGSHGQPAKSDADVVQAEVSPEAAEREKGPGSMAATDAAPGIQFPSPPGFSTDGSSEQPDFDIECVDISLDGTCGFLNRVYELDPGPGMDEPVRKQYYLDERHLDELIEKAPSDALRLLVISPLERRGEFE